MKEFNADIACEKCRVPYMPTGVDSENTYYGPSCKCWLDDIPKETENSGAQKVTESEDMINGQLHPAGVKQTHCWTFRADNTHCPGVVARTLDVQDGPYGHFCPECRHSLRYHPYYGQGRPGDLALKGQIPR